MEWMDRSVRTPSASLSLGVSISGELAHLDTVVSDAVCVVPASCASTSLSARSSALSQRASRARHAVRAAARDGAKYIRRRAAEARRHPALFAARVVVAVACVCALRWIVLWSSRRPPVTEAHLVHMLGPLTAPWAVLVQHAGASARLSIPAMEKERLALCAASGAEAVAACTAAALVVTTRSLPAWTLRVVDTQCADCTDTHTAAGALRALAPGASSHGVFATSAAPLGRIGPMVLAMASVTDDVDVRVELPRWAWLRHVYGDTFPTADGVAEAAPGGGAAAGAPYLAVMGIPSTDQRARVALRDAQRRTWLSYQEVARNDNQFRGALLTLYVFAAVEPAPVVSEPNVKAPRDDAMTPSAVPVNVTATPSELQERLKLLLPTTEEYGAAADTLLAQAEAEAAEALAGARYQQRRMRLRRDRGDTVVDDTPCAEVVTTWSDGTAATSALTYLAQSLSLPVTPAFTAPAEFICAASSALWQEALTHRNVVWIDMMTDRRPTTDKKLGDTSKWGLGTEVGMSQKLILWLEYAYHAFPTVPFIVKGDDDSYMKVPQFLSDVRYVMGGAQLRRPPPTSNVAAAATMANVSESTAECLYMGSMRSFRGVPFHAGMTFLLHRRVVRGVLEAPRNSAAAASDVVLVAVKEFDPALSNMYHATRFQSEDILTGNLVQASRSRSRELCPNNRMWYVRERFARFHDMHRGKMHDVTWSTVVAHRCTPADTYYLHHYFQAELAATLNMTEKTAAAAAAAWAAAQRGTMGPEVVGWDALPDVRWVRDTQHTPKYDMADADGVAVYHNVYHPFAWPDRHVHHGWESEPRR
ncbi:phosphoglycan beta 1,3 galactosyltransferase [Novymonas esmeraldas]|uniref:Phosphoglycan beta 1,3 galactosyltransferase n=1 Tax=Novymonas esmeraldas TaxID=1808958 RepID=A0AAW0EV34_9TRYP